MNQYTIILIYAAMIGGAWFFLVRPQKKKQQELNNLRNSLVIGDEIITIGGIVGKVSVVKDDELHIRVGQNQEILVIKKWAVGTVSKK